MKYVLTTFLLICTLAWSHGQGKAAREISHEAACQKFSPAVVRIDTARGRATGFMVSPDGWVVTAAHAVIDLETAQPDVTIEVGFPNSSKTATLYSPDLNSIGRDFALLKVDLGKTRWSELILGDESELMAGSPIAIIGFPFSAKAGTKFCLFGTVATIQSEPVSVRIVTPKTIPNGQEVNVDRSTVYIQSPSVNGLSGSPVISLKTGKVIGIVSTKLSGISPALDSTRKSIASMASGMPDVEITKDGKTIGMFSSVGNLIDVLQDQLANGLGSATGASDVNFALKQARRNYEQHHK